MNVGRFDELMVLADGQGLRIGECHLELAGQFVNSHGKSPWYKYPNPVK